MLVEKGNKMIDETHDLWERIQQKRKQSDEKVVINENKKISRVAGRQNSVGKGGLR